MFGTYGVSKIYRSYKIFHQHHYSRSARNEVECLLIAFISLFFNKVDQLDMHDGTMQAGKDAYDQTLSNYHTWYVRSGAKIAMYTLPTKEVLLEQVRTSV